MIKDTSSCHKIDEAGIFSKPFSPALLRYLLGSPGPRLGTGLAHRHLLPTPEYPCPGSLAEAGSQKHPFFSSQTGLSDLLTYFSLLN